MKVKKLKYGNIVDTYNIYSEVYFLGSTTISEGRVGLSDPKCAIPHFLYRKGNDIVCSSTKVLEGMI